LNAFFISPSMLLSLLISSFVILPL
jgi:hypothetical protein